MEQNIFNGNLVQIREDFEHRLLRLRYSDEIIQSYKSVFIRVEKLIKGYMAIQTILKRADNAFSLSI